MRAYARELNALGSDVILTHTAPPTIAMTKETRLIPIVFISAADPVGAGFVQSYARPGGNVTGFTNFEPSMSGKWLELLKEMAPAVKRFALLYNPDTAAGGGVFLGSGFDQASSVLGLSKMHLQVRNREEINAAITSHARDPGGGLVVQADPFTTVNRDSIIELATRHRLPTIYPFRNFVAQGGLISYGIDLVDMFARSGVYVDRILRGDRPENLPVQAPVKFELVVNLKAAKALGLNVPQTLLVAADEVID